MLQAPDCLVGWLHKFHRTDLVSLIKKINSKKKILTKFSLKEHSWIGIVDGTLGAALQEQPNYDIVTRVAVLWERMAGQISNELYGSEYNCIKHGFRVRSGGASISFGLQEKPDVPAPPEKMQVLGGSDFGTEFHLVRKLDGKGVNFWLEKYNTLWCPENYLNGLRAISMSVGIILSIVKVAMHYEKSTIMAIPQEENFFDLPWKNSTGVDSFTFDCKVRSEHLICCTPGEIMSVYDTK